VKRSPNVVERKDRRVKDYFKGKRSKVGNGEKNSPRLGTCWTKGFHPQKTPQKKTPYRRWKEGGEGQHQRGRSALHVDSIEKVPYEGHVWGGEENVKFV